MANVDISRVLFGLGTYASYSEKMKLPNMLYFCSDTKEMYLGSDRYAFGKDITIQITGSGDTVSNITWDADTKILTVVLSDAGSAESVVEAIQAALTNCVKNISSSLNSAIRVDSSNKDDVDISLNLATGEFAGNVQLTQSWHGLRADASIPAVPVEGVAAGEKIISLNNRQLGTTLTISTEMSTDGKQWVILKGIGGVEVSKFDATEFVSSGILEDVTLDGTNLILTFSTAGGGTKTIVVDLSALIEAYYAAVGGGLTLNTATNEFSITNSVTENTTGVNTDQNVEFGSTLTLNTITYDDHGSITGTHQIEFTIPAITVPGGNTGTSGSVSKVVTYSEVDSTGAFSGESADVVTTITDQSDNTEIPTAKAVYDIVDSHTYSAGAGITISNNVVSLPQSFYNYLVQQTFAKPTIDVFTVSELGGAAEVGTSVSITEFIHKESNIGNIQGTLTFKHGSSTVQSGVSPASSNTTVTLNSALTITRSSAGSETLTLSGTDTLGGAVSKSVSKSFYIPKFSGYNAATSITANDVLSMNKGQTIPTTVVVPSTAYIYFVTDGNITKVSSGGFDVPMEAPVNLVVSINGVSITYHVYRTSENILAGTYTFTIA